MRMLAIGVLLGALITALLFGYGLRYVSSGVAVTFSDGDASSPDWVRAGFERYRWSRVEAVRGWNGLYTGQVVARQANGRISSQGGIIDRGDGSWVKDGAWLSYAVDGNVTQVEIYAAGVIASALTIGVAGEITVYVYEDGRLVETLVHTTAQPPADAPAAR